jgi:hypothetical protein
MANVDVPWLVRHCALAIYKDGYVQGSQIRRVLHSFNIARGRLVEYGFLKQGSEKGGPENIKLTRRGVRREARHRREMDGSTKTAQWDKLYSLIQEGIELDEEGYKELLSDLKVEAVPSRQRRAVQRRVRLVKAARAASRPRVRRSRRAKRARAKKG